MGAVVWPRWPFRMRCRPSEGLHSMGAVVWPRWPFRMRCRLLERMMRCRLLERMHSVGAVVWPPWPFQHRLSSTVAHLLSDARSSELRCIKKKSKSKSFYCTCTIILCSTVALLYPGTWRGSGKKMNTEIRYCITVYCIFLIFIYRSILYIIYIYDDTLALSVPVIDTYIVYDIYNMRSALLLFFSLLSAFHILYTV